MSLLRPTAWLPIAGLLALVAGTLGWLLFGFAGDRTGVVTLPDTATGATDSARSTGSGRAGSRLTVEILPPQQRNWTRAEVEQLPAAAWKPWRGDDYIIGRKDVELWVRVTLRNSGGTPLHGVLEAGDYFMDRAEVWVQEGDEPARAGLADAGWRRMISGERVSLREKALWGRDVAFPISVPAQGERVVYWRAVDYFDPVVLPTWWPVQADFSAAQSRGLLAEGLYLGGLLALLGYNTMLWLRLRLADIGYYNLYLGTVALFIVIARAHLPGLLWPLGSPAVETGLTIVIALSGFFLIQFARAFMELKTRLPRGDAAARVLRAGMLLLAAGGLTTAWGTPIYWLRYAVLGIGVTHVGLFALALWAWRIGVRQAPFFVLSFACLFAGSLAVVVIWFSESPAKNGAMMGLMTGSALEMLLLSLAVADRFAQAQRDKMAAQARLVEETEQRRAIEEAYADELAVEVRERTRELEAANADKDRMLAVIGHDLRSPLTGLMKSADQPSADFARDTARTGRALLLMIEDLVLWARMRAGTCDVVAHPARALLQPAVALHRALAEHGGTELALDVPEDLRVETDLVLAQTLVRNLLANALKFARTRVRLRAQRAAGGGVRFSVSNDGPALPAEIIARLNAGQDEPMTAIGGLGLRLCREICAALGMRLEMCVPAEGGAEFAFTLPAVNDLKEENP